MTEGNVVARKKILIAVAGSACVRKVFLGNWRSCVTCGLNLMHRAVAGNTLRRIRIALRGCLAMNALPERFHFIGMAFRALPGR